MNTARRHTQKRRRRARDQERIARALAPHCGGSMMAARLIAHVGRFTDPRSLPAYLAIVRIASPDAVPILDAANDPGARFTRLS